MGCECQSVLYFKVDDEVALERGLAEGSDREDNSEEAIKARINTFNTETKPVIDFYAKFGKVHEIDASTDVNEVYATTRSCVLPQVSFLCGPMGAGKSVLGKQLCDKTNMKQLKFGDWIKENNLADAGDEVITTALIQHLAAQTVPRVLIENFPQTELQAKFFIKNAV